MSVVKLVKVGYQKIKVIRLLRKITGLNLTEARKVVSEVEHGNAFTFEVESPFLVKIRFASIGAEVLDCSREEQRAFKKKEGEETVRRSEINEDTDSKNINNSIHKAKLKKDIPEEKQNTEKYTANEMFEKTGKLITGGLSIINLIMVIGALLGYFDKNPIPFIVFCVVVALFTKLEEKFPRVPTIVIAALEIIALIICFNIADNVDVVTSVKDGTSSDYPGISYEKAFDNYFSNPTWKKVGKDEDGNAVVKFTGNCYYLNEEAIAEIKFTLYKEQGSFVVSSVKINGEDMGVLGNALIRNAFEEYQQDHIKKNDQLEKDVDNNGTSDNGAVLQKVVDYTGEYEDGNGNYLVMSQSIDKVSYDWYYDGEYQYGESDITANMDWSVSGYNWNFYFDDAGNLIAYSGGDEITFWRVN